MSMTKMAAAVLAVTSYAVVAAAPERSGRWQLFVAPSGQPFRADAGQPYPSATWFAQADRNHDGRIDESEFVADFAAYFASLDRDHDGKLSAEEIKQYEDRELPGILGRRSDLFGGAAGGGSSAGTASSRPEGGGGSHHGGGHGGGRRGMPEGSAGSGGMGGGGGGSGSDISGDTSQADRDYQSDMAVMGDAMSGAGRFGFIPIPEPIAAMDVNFDGTVDQQEMLAAAHRRFQLLAGDSGYITQSSLPRPAAQRGR